MAAGGVPVRIGLKYCGGCKPGYDRAALVAEIKSRLEGKALLLRPDSEGLFLILAVQGCETACADLSAFASKRVWTLTGPEQAEPFIAYIESLAAS